MKRSTEISLLAELVQTPSTSGNEGAASNVLMERLPLFGWERVEKDQVGNVVARRGSGAQELVLLGHIDTVPGGPCFGLHGQVLRGRGSVDAKGPLCSFIIAGAAVHIPEAWSITMIAAVGEETDSRGIKHRIDLHKPCACIVGEPTGGDGVVLSYRGRILCELHGEDRGGHRSWSPGPLTATVRAASEIFNWIESIDPDLPLTSRLSGSVVSMSGEESSGRSASVVLDIRLPLGRKIGEVIEKIQNISCSFGVSAEIHESVAAHGVRPHDPVVGALRSAIISSGSDPRLLKRSGSADFNMAAAWNCPMAVYGPGDSLLEHTEEEQIEIDEYLASIDILRSAIPNVFRILGTERVQP
ncbi:MAG TPA: M20/M25/M40 family metallo-hydrolase [Synergistales bacterium]|nr:M20/M25/M40 family metallo-hydrolase [Synergistales bacterium]